MKSPRFEVFQDKRGEWRWRLRARNGRVLAQGEGHTRERDAWRAVETVRGAAALAVKIRYTTD